MPDNGSQPVPETLAGLLTRRIDALPPHLRRTIEAAAVLGTEPADDLLQPLSGLRPEAYEAAITQLADGDLLFRIRSVPQRVYGFKHALVQEAAYQAIPTQRRKELHAKIVELRENDWRAGDKSLGALLAPHALASGQHALAVELALCATEQAVAQSSYPLADKMLGLALTATRSLPPTPNNRRTEAQILAWQRPLHPLAHTETMSRNLKLSRDIALDLGDDRLLVDTCIHLSCYMSDNGRFPLSLTYCDEAIAAANRIGDSTLVAEAAMARARTYFAQSKFGSSMSALKEFASFWDDRAGERGDFVLTRYVFIRHLQTCCHAGLGHTEAARRRGVELLTAAHDTGRPVDLFVAFLSAGEVLAAGNLAQQAWQVFEEAAEIAQQAGLSHFVLWARMRAAEVAVGIDGVETAGFVKTLHVATESAELSLSLRLSAEASLLCHRLDEGDNVLFQIRNLLERVRDVDLPAVELRILETLARCDTNGPKGWAASANTTRAKEGYAPCKYSQNEEELLMGVIHQSGGVVRKRLCGMQ